MTQSGGFSKHQHYTYTRQLLPSHTSLTTCKKGAHPLTTYILHTDTQIGPSTIHTITPTTQKWGASPPVNTYPRVIPDLTRIHLGYPVGGAGRTPTRTGSGRQRHGPGDLGNLNQCWQGPCQQLPTGLFSCAHCNCLRSWYASSGTKL
jgi:hypothetical protein